MELLYPNAVSRDYRYCTYTFLDHTHVHTHVKSISLIRAASQQSFQLCSKKKKEEKEKRKKKERTRTAPMAKWIFNGTLHLLFERWKIEVEAASQLIKGYPLQFGLVTRLRDLRSIPSGQRVKQRIDIRKKKKEERGQRVKKGRETWRTRGRGFFQARGNSFHPVSKQMTKRKKRGRKEK